jgi:hypothetical protein
LAQAFQLVVQMLILDRVLLALSAVILADPGLSHAELRAEQRMFGVVPTLRPLDV